MIAHAYSPVNLLCGYSDNSCTCSPSCPCKSFSPCTTSCCYRIPPGLSDSYYEIMTASSQTASGSSGGSAASGGSAGSGGRLVSTPGYQYTVSYRVEHGPADGGCCLMM
ncbi:hypothetical protein L198_02540 [Cryptococcus wingfieldii CBS 7118]|uniref:Uncharacterized protein n=1 Tax=Cryptococcus wingfieldii CBS 7118 TaxID=1295528 RepID=A0A1E3JLX4_9TREE|nr:hypothetical protein L198_02540 [Cryptococcus wingfieldii CBS 7118]ODO01813.1 hypothetical protein L198_02540 [Cryptococcus wingfieldii CBS 7118]